jgi:hypothetical protein
MTRKRKFGRYEVSREVRKGRKMNKVSEGRQVE